jgi:hypothetical protein
MALAQYTDTFVFSSGVVAASVSAMVFTKASPTPAVLWADAAGTIPLSQPLTTSVAGVLTFWAESGDYWVHLDHEAFLVNVGMSQEQADLGTGTASGGELNVNALNPLAVDIGPTDGYVVSYASGDQTEPVIVRVKTTAQTVALDAAALLRTATWWLLTSAGAVVQQATKPTNTQRRTHLVLGVTAHDGVSIFVDQSLPVILPHQGNQFADLVDALGPFSVSGNLITANGANLKIDQSAGTMFARAFNYYAGPVLTNDPHTNTTQAQAPAQFRYATRTTTVFPALVSDIDVANYDVGGVVTPIGGGVNNATVHRVWLFAVNSAPAQLAIQYGQTIYSSLVNAASSVGSGTHVINPQFPGVGALIAYIAVIRTATDLTNSSQATIIEARKFSI